MCQTFGIYQLKQIHKDLYGSEAVGTHISLAYLWGLRGSAHYANVFLHLSARGYFLATEASLDVGNPDML